MNRLFIKVTKSVRRPSAFSATLRNGVRQFSDSSRSTADFGFKDVNAEEKERMVKDVFSKVAEKYDVMNDVMSFGTHRLWKDELISMMGIQAAAHADPNYIPRHLDVAGGTGDVAFRSLNKILSAYGDTIRSNGRRNAGGDASAQQQSGTVVAETDRQIVICDINPDMLKVGKQRAAKLYKDDERNLVSFAMCL